MISLFTAPHHLAKPLRLVAGSLVIGLIATAGTPALHAASPVTDVLATDVVFYFGEVSYDFHLRANGVYLMPREQVALAVIDEVLFPEHQRRLQVVFTDLNRLSGTFGDVLAVDEMAFVGSPALRGLSATSFRNSSGAVDGLLAMVDTSPNRILITTIDGTTTTGGILGTSFVSGIDPAELNPTVIPALESGTRAGENRIFIAFASTMGGEASIQTGFLQRTGPALWRFQRGVEFPAGDGEGPLCNQPDFEVAAAFDATRHEFTAGWICGSFSAFARRLDWNAQPVGPMFLAHRGYEGVHSGATLSFNQLSDRYFFTFQHNSALLIPGPGGGLSCSTPDPVVEGCFTSVSCTEHGGQWSAEVDYACGFEFRSGGRHSNTPWEGANFQLVTGQEGARCSTGSHPYDWSYESEIWPTFPLNDLWTLHEYVRCPRSGVTVAIHLYSAEEAEVGELRYSFIDEPMGFAFDDQPQPFAMDTRFGLISALRDKGSFASSSCLGYFYEHPALADAFEALEPKPGDVYYNLWRIPGGDFGDATLPNDIRDLLDEAGPCLGDCQLDLVAQRLHLSGNCAVQQNEDLDARLTAEVANVGTGTTGSGFIGFYLSDDPIITTSDTLLTGGRESLPSLVPGEVLSISTSMTIPAGYPAGPAHLGILVDEFDAVFECRESNNQRVIPISIQP